ncbi:AMY [Mytilus edulis]|uniref:AMY n=1 Tax=Mytilus edulis TaxID=6550 RepID=A0A8S3SLJ0_MYTED|nr:AMY [Mytilus edulis]
MVAFRNVVSGTYRENWWDDGDYQIAFSRGNKGFIAINAGALDMRISLQTGLPPGTYCDVISGNYKHGRCTGMEVNVHSDGTAYFNIESSSDDFMVALHIGTQISFCLVCKQKSRVDLIYSIAFENIFVLANYHYYEEVDTGKCKITKNTPRNI